VRVRKIIAGTVLGLGAAGIVLLLAQLGWLDVLELKTYDWRVRQSVASPPRVNSDIVLVEINDTTLRDLESAFGRWPWPRVTISMIVDFLNRAPAKVIALDLAFLEQQRGLTFKLGADQSQSMTGEDSDGALVESVRRAGNVVLLADAVYMGAGGAEGDVNKPATWRSAPYRLGPAIEERPIVVPPFQTLTDAASGLGHNWLPFDEDGPARRMAPFVRVGDKYLPSLGIVAALMAGGFKPDDVVLDGRVIRVRDREIPLVSTRVAADATHPEITHDQLTMLIDYQAPALVAGKRPYKSYEARYVIESENSIRNGDRPHMDPAEFKNKIVFVGVTASGLGDRFQTPFGSQGTMPGVQLHASMADSLLSNHFVRPARDRTRIGATVGGALFVGLASTLVPFIGAAAATLAVVGGWSWFALHLFKDGLWANMVQPLLAMGLALFGGTTYRYFIEDAEKRKVSRLFGRYVSKDVYDQLLANPASAELGGARRDMTVLFSDIRGFTSVTEKGDPEALVAQLNEYFTRMVDVVFRHHGTVDKFVGDMVMALFGAPLDDVNHAEHAAEAAVDMVREVGTLNERWAAEGRPVLDIGIGVNSGEMIAGNIGSSAIMSYTVIGDNVNLGSRLESLNKDYRTRIIISDATRARLKGDYRFRPLGDVIVKGKTRPVSIFEIVVPSPIPSAPEEVKL
jgi:adenylate cyclase